MEAVTRILHWRRTRRATRQALDIARKLLLEVIDQHGKLSVLKARAGLRAIEKAEGQR